MRVIGTAGHVDHGKSTLVKRLTGIDPDRLAEEKTREMTIDLGFAWFELPGHGTIGVVDVPGHRDFIENMLAGIAGLDAVILVIAADEGIMPQTREHLAIIKLLGITDIVVALTKIDLVKDPEWLDLVQEDIRDTLSQHHLNDINIVPVSALKDQSIDNLIEVLSQLLEDIPPRPDFNHPYLPIDRVFSLSGFGTIITGTLSNGSLRIGDEVEIFPDRQKSRIRGIQTYNNTVDIAHPGSRVAVNLSGVRREEIQRGNVLSLPNRLNPSQLIDVYLEMLDVASRPLKHNAEVKIFTGASEITGRVRLLDKDLIQPGESGWVQLHLAEPLTAMRNDRYILRFPSPAETIAGGVIVDPNPPHRWKRFRLKLIKALETKLQGTPEELLADIATGNEPISTQQLLQQSGLDKTLFEETLASALEKGLLKLVYENHVLSHQKLLALLHDLEQRTLSYHETHPLRRGIPREHLRQQLDIKNTTLTALLNQSVVLEIIDNIIKHKHHTIALTPKQGIQAKALMQRFSESPFTPPTKTEAIEMVGDTLFYGLIELGELVPINDELVFETKTYQTLVKGILRDIEENGATTVKSIRDRFNTSRKYAIGLLEHLDALGITRRVGDERIRGNADMPWSKNAEHREH